MFDTVAKVSPNRDPNISSNGKDSAVAHCIVTHANCRSFKLSPSWEYLASWASTDTKDEIKLWNLHSARELACFKQSSSPVFSLDGRYMLYINVDDDPKTVIAYGIQSSEQVCRFQCRADLLTVVPIFHDHILVTQMRSTDTNGCAIVSLWNFSPSAKRFSDFIVAPSGLVDVSKNGRLGLDSLLQVVNIHDGSVKARFTATTAGKKPTTHFDIACLTYDGKYVIWAENMLIKVGRTSDGSVIAETNLHERATCLHTMDYGYVIIVGGEDGHVFTMKLFVSTNENEGMVTYRPSGTEDRRNFLLDAQPCSEDAINEFDPVYRTTPECMADVDIPTVSESLSLLLVQKADVPYTILSTERMQSEQKDNSSPLPYLTAMMAKSYLTALSPNESKDDSLLARSPPSLEPNRLKSPLARQRSRSLQDLNNPDLAQFSPVVSPTLPTSPNNSKANGNSATLKPPKDKKRDRLFCGNNFDSVPTRRFKNPFKK